MENGKSAIARNLHNGIGFGTTEFHVLRSGPLVIPEWLHFFVRRDEFREAAKKSMQGAAGQQRVPIDFLRHSEIPIPPLDEQRRIVARIEELTRRADEVRRLRQEAVEEIGKSLAATVDAVFNERDENWTEATVKQLCGKPQYGYTASATNKQVGPHFLRITDIQNSQVDWKSVPYCSCDEPEKYRLSGGDIVFARTGATTGKSYLVRKPPESVFASYLIRIRPGERVLPEYIWWYFQSSSYWASVFRGIDDGNRPNMNGSKLGALKIPFPRSKKTQRQIVSRLEALAEKMSELRHLQTTAETELSTFQPAILAKAFRGEL
jgi:type I restriction enzyme S subunit